MEINHEIKTSPYGSIFCKYENILVSQGSQGKQVEEQILGINIWLKFNDPTNLNSPN